MKFLLVYTQKSTPEWSECYYDYKTLKLIIRLCQKAYAIQSSISDINSVNGLGIPNEPNQNEIILNEEQIRDLTKASKKQILHIVKEANQIFYVYHDFNIKVIFLFLQMKIHELHNRSVKYQKWGNIAESKVYNDLIANTHSQFKMLETTAEMNSEAHKKVIKKHEKIFSRFKLPTPKQKVAREKRTIELIEKNTVTLKSYYESKLGIYPRKARDILNEQIQFSPLKSSFLSYLFGLANGFSVATIITALILIILHLQASYQFQGQYRAWKFIGFIYLYMWVFAVTFYIYEKNRINYHLIFAYETPQSKSIGLLGVSSVGTLIFSILFALYVMELADIKVLPFEMQVTFYFPIALFILFLIYILTIFTVKRSQATNYFLKTLVQTLLCFLPFVKIGFGVGWASEQLISQVQIINDFMFSACYYTRQDNQQCKILLIGVQISAVIIFMLRIIQCIRVMYQNNHWIGSMEFFITIRCLLNILLCTLSALATLSPDEFIWAWFALVFPIVLYGYFVDVYYDWGLITINQNSETGRVQVNLRKRKKFSNLTYYILIGICLVLRFTWVATICSSILYFQSNFSYPELTVTCCAIGQLFRRGIWNVMRVEKQHIRNCENFQVRTDYDEKQRVVLAEIRAKQGNSLNSSQQIREMDTCFDKDVGKCSRVQHYSLHSNIIRFDNPGKQRQAEQAVRNKEQVTALLQLLDEKATMQSNIRQWVRQSELQLEQIEQSVKSRIYKERK